MSCKETTLKAHFFCLVFFFVSSDITSIVVVDVCLLRCVMVVCLFPAYLMVLSFRTRYFIYFILFLPKINKKERKTKHSQ
jgi:hypothetical protein